MKTSEHKIKQTMRPRALRLIGEYLDVCIPNQIPWERGMIRQSIIQDESRAIKRPAKPKPRNLINK